jgi:hypothetical protein
MWQYMMRVGRGFLKKPDSGFFEITKAGRITRLDL